MTTKKLRIALAGLLLLVGIGFATVGYVGSGASGPSHPDSIFNTAVNIIMKYEGLHKSRNWPYIGYGHRVLSGEKYRRGTVLGQEEAEELLRKDLRKYMSQFRQYGADSVLLGVLAYNIGSGNVRKSSLPSLLGDEEKLRETYLAHCRYRGKVMSQIQRRRTEEFDTLYPLVRAAEDESAIIEKMEAIAADENRSLSWVLVTDPEKLPGPGRYISSSSP